MNIITKTGKASFRLACLGTIMGFLTAVSVEAGTVWNFSGSANGGTASGTMDITSSGTTITALIDNTSPIILDAPLVGTNTPAITGIGFNLSDPIPSIVSWELTAFNLDGSGPVVIGSNTIVDGAWILSATIDGVTLDFGTETATGGKGGLYSPLATSGFGGPPRYETQAVLTIVFADTAPIVEPNTGSCGSGLTNCETFLRFQTVGLNGAGSLKIPGTTGTPGSTGEPGVPEPNSLSLLGLGMIASVFALRRRNRYFKA